MENLDLPNTKKLYQQIKSELSYNFEIHFTYKIVTQLNNQHTDCKVLFYLNLTCVLYLSRVFVREDCWTVTQVYWLLKNIAVSTHNIEYIGLNTQIYLDRLNINPLA